jgi:hypothetical protein
MCLWYTRRNRAHEMLDSSEVLELLAGVTSIRISLTRPPSVCGGRGTCTPTSFLASLHGKLLTKGLANSVSRGPTSRLVHPCQTQVSGDQATIPNDLACDTNKHPQRGRHVLRQSRWHRKSSPNLPCKAVVTQGQMSYLDAPNTAATVSLHEVEIHPFLMYPSVI